MGSALQRTRSWWRRASRSSWTSAAAWTVLAAAFGLYLAFGIGLTREAHERSLHHDEVVFATVASRMAAEHNLNPRWFGHPGSTQIYPLALAYWLTLDQHPDQGDAASRITDDHFRYSLAARSVSYLIFLAALIAVFQLVRSSVDPLSALVAMALFASPVMLAHAPFLRNDGTSILFVALALIASRKAASTSRVGAHILFGVSLGAAIATKYYLVFVAAAYAGSLLELRARGLTRPHGLRLSGVVLGSAILALFCFAPYLFLDGTRAARHFELQVGWTSPSQPFLSYGPQLLYFLERLWSIHGAWLFAAALGIWTSVAKRDRVTLAAGAGAVVYLLAISAANAYYERWLLPLFPVTCCFVAHGLAVVGQKAWHLVERGGEEDHGDGRQRLLPQ